MFIKDNLMEILEMDNIYEKKLILNNKINSFSDYF